MRVRLPLRAALLAANTLTAPYAMAQPAPPAVGVVTVERRPMTDIYEINARIEPMNSVNIVARVTAFLENQLFVDGSQVKKGDLLYTLEKRPFVAAVDVQKAAVARAEAELENDALDFRRAQQLAQVKAGSQQAADNAQATQRIAAAQLKAAQAQLETAQINLDYTEIRSPIDGRIGRSLVDEGNVVGPASGTMATVVSQDPMYVVFSIPTRRAFAFRDEYARKGAFDALEIRVRLPDGRLYGETGKLDFVNNIISEGTDTLLFRGVIPNPFLGPEMVLAGRRLRELSAGEFVTVLLESVQSRQVIAMPRAALLADQQGPYVYVVDDHNVARQRRVRVGQSTPELTGIVDGLVEGERIVVEGIQRVRPNAPVSPGPASSFMNGS